MKRVFPLVLTLALCVLAAVLLVRLLTPAPSYDPVRYAAEQRALEQAEALAPLDLALAAAWRLVPLAAVVVLLVIAARWAWLRVRLVRVGGEPIVLDDLRNVSPTVLAGYAETALAAAQHPHVPHSISSSSSTHYAPTAAPHYAPHLAYRNDVRALDAPALAAAEAARAIVPAFAQLLDGGRFGPGQALLLGHDLDTGAEVAGSWLDLYSTIVSGLPGSGKTTSQRFLGAQTALQGARFVIVDPHAGAADDSLAATLAPLGRAFLCEPASSDKAILEAVRLVADIGDRRVKGLDTDTTPVILWLDETTALLARSTVAGPLAELIERIAQEYRKKRIFVSASGQIWSADRTGDSSALRDSFASVLCHRMKRSQARLLLPTEEAATVERLAVGEAVLWRTSGQTCRLVVPNTTAADVQAVAQRLGGLATPRHTDMPKSSQNVAWNMPGDMPEGSLAYANGNLATSASGSQTAASAEAMRAAGMFLAGSDMAAIVAELRNVRSDQGKRYQVALAEVQQLVRTGMQASTRAPGV